MMVQTLLHSSRRPFFSRYCSLFFLPILTYIFAVSIFLCTSVLNFAENPSFLTYHFAMASSSTNPNPISALDDEDKYKDTLRAASSSPHKKNPFQLSNSTPFEEFFPRLHPTPDAQDLQQAVDQFLHVDSPHSSPVSSSPFGIPPNTATTHATPSVPVRPTAPIISDSISVSTHIDKSKGKAPMIAPSSRTTRKDSGLVINVSCPPGNATTPPVVKPTFVRQEAHIGGSMRSMLKPTDHLRNFTGAGFVLKRGHHSVLASNCNRLPGVVSPIFSESQALIQGLNWCLESQFTPQVVFSDCLNLVSKVNGDWHDNSALSGLVSRIRLLFSNFPGASLQYIPRQFNVEAHNFAREALRFRDVMSAKPLLSELKKMPNTRFSGSVSSPDVSVTIDMGHPFLNHTVDGFLKIGAIAATRAVAEDVFHVVKKGSISKGNVEHTLKKMCKEGAYWGTVAGVYKNAMIGGALTGALVSIATSQDKDKIVINAITGGAIATASEFINYLT
ncbi:hypothetical protein G4B88_009480 [Cannabis sativa]|uniref:RNase H type-1 domain-containing protein n=1 Tax=Cannabis sativa TaxID=3483 RepID=A0A7J6EWZ3_CANSA|nr:hypothetical protein G4B88_009480 [Cannabis sativa]